MAKTKVQTKKAKAPQDVWYVVIAIFVGICLLAGLLVAILKPTGLWDSITLHANTAMKSEHYSIDNAEFTYVVYSIYNNYYQTYYQSYSSYMSAFGLDRSKPLSEQKYFGGDTSWLERCVLEAEASLQQVLYLCEAASAEGMTLSDENKQTVEENIEALANYAKSNNYSFSSYVANLYGSKGITKGDIRKVMELQYLASQYSTKVRDGFSYTDEQYNKYYDENKLKYLKADYYTYTVKADYESDADDEAKQAAVNAAKAKAEELLKKIDDGEDFVKVIGEYKKELAEADLAAAKESGDEEKISAATDALDALTEESIKKELEVKAHQNSDDNEADKWIFDETPAADGSSKLISGDESFSLYQIIKSAYRDDYKAVNISELYMTLDDFANMTAAKEYAQKIIDEFNAGSDKSSEAFAKLAEKYTTEDITVSSSGHVEESSKVGSDKYADIDEWLFSEERQAGDVKSFEFEDEGVAIYLFESFGRESWLVHVDSDMRSADYEDLCKELEEKYPVTFDEKAIAKVN